MIADSRERSLQILEEAKLAGEEIIRRAREEAAALTDSHTIANAARERAREIIEHAEEEGRCLREEAERYVRITLSDLESHLSRVMSSVHKGLAKLEEHSAIPSVVAVSAERS